MSASGLSDVLRDMARGRAPSPPRSPSAHRPASVDEVGDDDATPPPAAVSVRRPSARTAEPDALRMAAVPVLLVVGAVLFVPGLWAVAVLAGLDVWRADWPGATRMAAAMLACLPLGGVLLGGAWWLHREQRAARATRRRRTR